MPITPLHFGLIPLLNRATKRKMSAGGFILANVMADVPIILNIIENEKVQFGAPPLGHAIHEVFTHNFIGAIIFGFILGLIAFKKRGWLLGCVLGSVTHVLLDMFVHSDVTPFSPFTDINPFYFERGHLFMSAALSLGCAVWLLQCFDRRIKHHQT